MCGVEDPSYTLAYLAGAITGVVLLAALLAFVDRFTGRS